MEFSVKEKIDILKKWCRENEIIIDDKQEGYATNEIEINGEIYNDGVHPYIPAYMYILTAELPGYEPIVTCTIVIDPDSSEEEYLDSLRHEAGHYIGRLYNDNSEETAERYGEELLRALIREKENDIRLHCSDDNEYLFDTECNPCD